MKSSNGGSEEPGRETGGWVGGGGGLQKQNRVGLNQDDIFRLFAPPTR